jgi:hypothetical protein
MFVCHGTLYSHCRNYLLILSVLIAAVAAYDLQKEKVRFMDFDKATGNFLYRGNEPKV